MVNTIVGINNPSGRLPYTLYPANMTAQRKINDYGLRSVEGLTYKWYSGRLSGPALWEFGEVRIWPRTASFRLTTSLLLFSPEQRALQPPCILND